MPTLKPKKPVNKYCSRNITGKPCLVKCLYPQPCDEQTVDFVKMAEERAAAEAAAKKAKGPKRPVFTKREPTPVPSKKIPKRPKRR